MATATPLPARWALYGKEAGQTEDYRLLSESDGARLAGEVVEFVPGTPSSAGAGEASALPWVTAGGLVNRDGLRRIAVSVCEWADPPRLDAFKRRVALTRYYQFDLRSAELAGAGYQALYRAVVAAALPAETPLTRNVARTDLAALAERVAELGFDWLLRVAALLLDGPVVLVGPVPAEVPDRLGVLDAVAALLPYGFRADLVVGTWIPDGGRRKIRLGFGAEGGGAGEVRLDAAPALDGASEIAQQYHRRVSELWRRWDVERVVRGLWDQTEPREFRDATGALEALSHLDLPYAVAADVRANRIRVDEVVHVVSTCSLDAYSEDVRDLLLRTLIRHGADGDLALVRPYWSTGIRELFVEEAARGREKARALACAAVAEAAGELEPFLAELCRRAVLAPDGPANPAAVATLAGREPPAAGAWPGVWHSMSHSPALGLRLLSAVTDQPLRTLPRWIDWLVGGPEPPTDWMLAIAPVVDARPLGASHTNVLAGLGPYALHATLTVGVAQERAHDLLDLLWRDLVKAINSPYREAIRQVLLTVPAVPLSLRGVYDILVVLYGGRPPLSPSALTERDRRDYLDAMAPQLRSFRSGRESTLAKLVDAELGRGLRPLPSGQAVARYLTELAEAVGPELRHVVLTRLADAAAGTPESIDGLPRAITGELLDLSQRLRQFRTLREVEASARDDALPEELARAWLAAADAGLRGEDIAEAARDWPGGRDRHRIGQFVSLLEARIRQRSGAERALDAYIECLELVLTGRLGTVADEYRQVLVAKMADARNRWDRVERLLKSTRQRRFGRGGDGRR